MPMTAPGRLVAAASFVTEIDDVFVAMIAPGFAAASILAKSFSLSSRFSVAASIRRSQSFSAPMSVVVLTRASTAPFSAAVILSFFTRRSRLASIVFTPRSSCGWPISLIVTGYSATANACAMPLPIVPAPMTPIVLMSTSDSLSNQDLAGHAANVHLVVEPLNRRPREVPRQPGGHRAVPRDLVREERMQIVHRVRLGRGRIFPADAERLHAPFDLAMHPPRLLAQAAG